MSDHDQEGHKRANQVLREICELVSGWLETERDVWATVADKNSYGAGYSDGVIQALGDVFHEAARRMTEHP